MAGWAYSIRKSTSWRGKTQSFSNLYHYDVSGFSTGDHQNVLTALKAAEVPVHSTAVNFVEGRAWGPVDSQGRGGSMVDGVIFSGTGSATQDLSIYKELAILCTWALGRYGSRNRPQFMRKWLHTMSLFGGTNPPINGATAAASTPAAITTYMAAVRVLTPTGGGTAVNLMTPSGHFPLGAGAMYPYLEHHQFGR